MSRIVINSCVIIMMTLSANISHAGILDDLWTSSVELYDKVYESITSGSDEGNDQGSADQGDQPEVEEIPVSTGPSIIDHRTKYPETISTTSTPARTRDYLKYRASLDEMGASFNCENARLSYGRISVFNTPMTEDSARCIASQTIAPEAFNEYLKQMSHVNEWTFLTVVAGEYINQLDEATAQLFGKEFNWDELKEINPYCDQYSDIVKEARSKRKTKVQRTSRFDQFFKVIPNPSLALLIKELDERPIKELVNGKTLKIPLNECTLVELLRLQKEMDKQVSSAVYNKSVACSKEVGSARSCDYAYFDREIANAKSKLKNIEKQIRTREGQFPYLAQSYSPADSITDISNLMSFYGIQDGREKLYELKTKYDQLKEQGKSDRDLQTQMKGALAPSIVEKKKQYKNLLAGVCSSNIPISQTNNKGLPWTALSSADHIIKRVEKSNPNFSGFAQCLRNAADTREKTYGTAAMAGAALCFGTAIGMGSVSMGAATIVGSAACGAAFFGLDAMPKIETSKALSSSITCQQLLGKETCSDEERQRIEDLDWWSTFGTTATVAGEAVGIGMDSFTFGSRAVRAIRKLPKSRQQATVVDQLYQLQDFYRQQRLIEEMGQLDYDKAIEFMDDIRSQPDAARFFYPGTSKEQRLSVVQEYLKRKGIDPQNAQEFLDNLDLVLKEKGKSLEEAAEIVAGQKESLEFFKQESELAHDLASSKYFEQIGDTAKLDYLRSKYPHASEQQIQIIKSQLDSYITNAQDPQGLLELMRVVDTQDSAGIRAYINPENLQEAVERARSLGYQGTDKEIQDAIVAERVSSLWSVLDGANITPKLKRTLLETINDPKVREEIVALNQRSCQ